MSKEKSHKGNWSDLIQIYRMMFRYWHILVTGLVAMLFFALFSGISITLVIPLFDYVFNPNKTGLIYHDPSSFLSAVGVAWGQFISSSGNIFAIKSLGDLAPFWESLKEIMLRTDSLSLLYVLCGFVVVTILLKNLFYFIQRVLFVRLRGNTIRDVRNMMFRRYMNQSLEFYNQNRVGDAIVRMVNDVEIVSEQFIKSLLEGIRDLVTILVYMRIALLLNSRLFAYSIVVLPAFTLLVGFLGRKIKKYSRRIQAQLSSMFSTVEEALNSMKIVKAFRREDSEYQGFSRINRTHLKLWKKAQTYSAMNLPISEINTTLTGVVVIVIGGRMILQPGSTFSLGDFTAFLFALFSMLHPLKTLTQIYTEIKKAMVSLGRISLVMNQQSTIQDAPDAIDKPDFIRDIVFERVGFHYEASKPVLQDVSLTIRKGEKIAFVGASGGGKTTLANLFNRMYDVKEGKIKMDGIDIRQIKLAHLRRLFGVVTQDSVLFTKSIRENIAYGTLEEVSDDQVRKAARIAHAEEFILAFPSQFDEILQTKGANLSGGQRQRLCIARAIVGDPPILIFDEATSALDTESEKLVQQAIDEATQNRTVIMIAHRLSTVLKADRIVVLEHGKIVGTGRHDELLQSCERYQKLYNMQFHPGENQ
ncbi:MAG: ABC transporter ATP-binding protein/permease [Candidatus Syntrophosphaera sp.]|nr:ABC transporter ATP-binding protein/permease [Candidatus Syntrophosphaera sp.]